MKQTNSRVIKANRQSHFLADERKFLPANCLFNKGITGCGGTTLEIDCPRNSLILVPNINLVVDKCASHPSLIGVYGEVSNSEISAKLQEQIGYHKIIATYDALPRIIECVGSSIYSYFLLIDEYHILFNSYSFRYGPIKFILDNYSKFDKFCFMTATPLEEFNILEEIKDLPRVTMEWPQAVKMSITVRNAFFTNKEVLKEILLCKDNDWNLHIFINSINTIRSIVKQIPSEITYRTICSKEAAGKDTRLGGTLNVSEITSPIKKINFYTATAFEGVDIYDPKGKTIIVSDTQIAQTLVDISTLMIQICGRLRDSIYKDSALFICNTNNHRYMKYKSENEFKVDSDIMEQEAIAFQKDMEKSTITTQKNQYELYQDNPVSYHTKYLGEKQNKVCYDPNLKKIDRQNFDIITKVFNSTVSVIKNIEEKTECKIEIKNKNEIKKLYSLLPGNMNIDLYRLKILLDENDLDLKLFTEYYDKRILTLKGKRVTVYDFTKLRSIINLI